MKIQPRAQSETYIINVERVVGVCFDDLIHGRSVVMVCVLPKIQKFSFDD
jgi:hypothetical protein